MAISVPLIFTEMSPGNYFCATRATHIMSMNYYNVRDTVKQEKRNGTLINGCGSRAAKSAIFLDNGSVSTSPVIPKTLVKRIYKDQNMKNREDNIVEGLDEEEEDIPFDELDIPFDEIVNEELEDEDE